MTGRVWILLLLCSYVIALPSRRLQQTDAIRVDAANVEDFVAAVEEADEDTTFRLSVDVSLSSLLNITTRGVNIVGVGDSPPRLRCTDGGSIVVRSDDVVIQNLSIEDCFGGAVSLLNDEAVFDPFDVDAVFDFETVNVTFVGVVFRNNVADPDARRETGGALTVGPGTLAVVVDCTFVGNDATTGGAILVDGAGSLTVRGTAFENNTATIAGGAIAAGFTENFFDRRTSIIVRRSNFTRNRDLSGTGDAAGLRLSNGAPLENSVFLRFPSPTPSGGAMYLHGYSRVILDRCIFDENTAVPAGGALYISDNEEVTVVNCNFTNNSVDSVEAEGEEEDRNLDLEMGGAIYLAFTDVSSGAVFDRCTFRENRAAYGGVIHAVTELASRLSIVNCQFEDNEAELAGGAVLLRNIIQARIRNTRFNRNRATVGGGMMMTNGAGAGMFVGPTAGFAGALESDAPFVDLDIYFTDNAALDGGGMFLLGAGQMILQAVRFTRNRARRNGGGMCLISSLPSGQTAIQRSHFHSNSALRGGAVFVDSVSDFQLLSEEGTTNEFIENVALAGGALHVRPSSQISNVIRVADTVFRRNRAVLTVSEAEIDDLDLPDVDVETSALGRRLAWERHLMQIEEDEESDPVLLDTSSVDACRPGGGGAMCMLLTQVPDRAPVEIVMSSVDMRNNDAHVGGALFAATSMDDDWIADCASEGTATESLTSRPCKSFSIVGTSFIGNSANAAGGGIFVSHPETIFTRLSEDSDFIRFSEVPVEADIFEDNQVRGDGFGNNMASNAVSMELIEPVIERGALLFVGHNSGEDLPEIRLQLRDVYDQVVTDGIVDAAMSISINSSIVSGQRVASAERGQVLFSKVTALGRPIVHSIIFVPNSLATRPVSHRFSIRQCIVGESRIDDKNVCDVCDPEFFGFNYNFTCDGCPDNAKCTGKAVLVPIQGYWHSTPYSPVIHECILEEACSYFGRKRQLEKFYKTPAELVPSNVTVSEEEYPQCAENYTGILCGSCEKGYGHVIDGECVECRDVWITAVLIIIVCFWTLFLLVSTAKAAFDTMREMTDMRMVRVLTMNTERAGSSRSHPPRPSQPSANSSNRSEKKEVTFSAETSEGGSGTQGRMASARSSRKKFESASGDDNVDHIMAAEKVSETIKVTVIISFQSPSLLQILTNFFQITSVGVGINASWTQSIRLLLVVEDSVSSVSSGASFAPMECLMENLEDRTLIGIVLRTLFPLVLTVVYIIGTVYKHRAERASIKRRVIIGTIVGIFFAYDTVTEMLMRIVNCISLDDPKPEDPDAPSIIQRYSQYATARDEYWAEDTNHVCWEGSHGIVAGVLGVPGLVLITFGIPFFLSLFLLYKRHRGVVLEPECLNTYGFVYQSYQAKFVFWESIIMLRKVSMAAVIVFAYDLGPNLQSAIALGILIFALLAQFLAQPFKYSSLNMLESLSLLASIFIFYSGVVFRDSNTSYAGKVILSIIIVTANLAMVILFLYRLFVTYDHLIIVKLRLEKVEDIPDTAVERIKLLSKINAEKVKESLQEKLAAAKSKISKSALNKEAAIELPETEYASNNNDASTSQASP